MLYLESHDIPVEDVQLQDGKNHPEFVTRNIKADGETFVFTRKRAACDAKELVGSREFEILGKKFPFGDRFVADTRSWLAGDAEGVSESCYNWLGWLQSMLDAWLSMRSLAQFKSTGERGHSAELEALNLVGAIKDLVSRANQLAEQRGERRRVEFDEGVFLGPVTTVIGGIRSELSKDGVDVFRVKDGEVGVYYGEGVNVETHVKRRSTGAEVKLMSDLPPSLPHEREYLNGTKWTERRFIVGGMPVAIYFNSQFGSQMMPGAEALFGNLPPEDGFAAQFLKSLSGDQEALFRKAGFKVPAEKIDRTPSIKLFFGVESQHMRGEDRILYTRDGELRMMLNAREGMDYFGYLKKTLLYMMNVWLTVLSSAMAIKRFRDRQRDKVAHGGADVPVDYVRQMDAYGEEFKMDFPHQLMPLLEHMIGLMGVNRPERFESLMPQVEIPEIEYRPNKPGFDPGRYVLFPVHGAAYTVRVNSDKGESVEYNLVLPGDSGVGKSEILRELQSLGIEVAAVQADDMLFMIYDKESGKTFSIGDERGAFTKTDDLPEGGSVRTTNVRPVVGYNANEKGGNRRVLEPNVSRPMEPKRVDGTLLLVNAYKHESNEVPRVSDMTLEDMVQVWSEGPYKKSSSVAGGGGVDAPVISAKLWNEFGPQHFFGRDGGVGIYNILLREMFIEDPEVFGGVYRMRPERASERLEGIREERARMFALRANTFSSSPETLPGVFRKTAEDLAAHLKGMANAA